MDTNEGGIEKSISSIGFRTAGFLRHGGGGRSPTLRYLVVITNWDGFRGP